MMISYQYQLSSICYVDVKGTNVLIPCSIQVVGNTATRTQRHKVFGVAGNCESERVKTPMVCGCGGVSLRFVHPFFIFFSMPGFRKGGSNGQITGVLASRVALLAT
jgi:hypothetical protein